MNRAVLPERRNCLGKDFSHIDIVEYLWVDHLRTNLPLLLNNQGSQCNGRLASGYTKAN